MNEKRTGTKKERIDFVGGDSKWGIKGRQEAPRNRKGEKEGKIVNGGGHIGRKEE